MKDKGHKSTTRSVQRCRKRNGQKGGDVVAWKKKRESGGGHEETEREVLVYLLLTLLYAKHQSSWCDQQLLINHRRRVHSHKNQKTASLPLSQLFCSFSLSCSFLWT